ncbi:MAG: YicC/YloC family endoribonuclease [Pseudomonadota bacterium]
MISSMTAYAVSACTEPGITVSVEIRSVNSRHLDQVVRLPGRYGVLEERVKAHIAAGLTRGRIDTHIAITDSRQADAAFQVDDTRADAYMKALTHLQQRFDLPMDGQLGLLAAAGGVITAADTETDPDGMWAILERCLSAAVGDLVAMRQREGAFIGQDLAARLDAIDAALEDIAGGAEGLTGVYQKRLADRIQALTDGMPEIDPVRIAQEAALLADRSDISEEITRARSHIAQYRHLMDAPEAAGRKLNFLLQELGREFNTMGAKVGKAELAHRIVDVKAELEKVREQIQNIE